MTDDRFDKPEDKFDEINVDYDVDFDAAREANINNTTFLGLGASKKMEEIEDTLNNIHDTLFSEDFYADDYVIIKAIYANAIYELNALNEKLEYLTKRVHLNYKVFVKEHE